jgi:hypothetical protein
VELLLLGVGWGAGGQFCAPSYNRVKLEMADDVVEGCCFCDRLRNVHEWKITAEYPA